MRRAVSWAVSGPAFFPDRLNGRRGRRRVGLLAVLLMLLAAQAAAEIYKWTDADGSVHYGERPPPGQEIREMPSAPPLPDDDVQRSRERLDRLLERQQRSEQLRQESREKALDEKEERARQAAGRKARCINARQNLHTLELDRPVYSIDEKGDRVFLDDPSRARLLERLRQEIESYCD